MGINEHLSSPKIYHIACKYSPQAWLGSKISSSYHEKKEEKSPLSYITEYVDSVLPTTLRSAGLAIQRRIRSSV